MLFNKHRHTRSDIDFTVLEHRLIIDTQSRHLKAFDPGGADLNSKQLVLCVCVVWILFPHRHLISEMVQIIVRGILNIFYLLSHSIPHSRLAIHCRQTYMA